ncbi:fatty acid-binding protein, adipocyte [Lingula anatina]|uniref:Fatty acid-binding protein, adipocyte n=1 Tax=Lingula anatina TaxID=7574 RepID=A0A1S3HJT6_LINAN|nr:fatty acid-binding protein, adipocyte [Lingula anatina]|eukprot:XP_013386385.1 fatty acid-binding protein, adipocyte [Lingula anatina]
MEAICGDWMLCGSDNLTAYLVALNVTEENIKKVTDAQEEAFKSGDTPKVQISKDGDTMTIKSHAWGDRVTSAKLGETFEHTAMDGRKGKLTYSMEGNTLLEVFEGEGLISMNRRWIQEDKLVYTLTAKGITTTRVYKKQ